MMEEAHQYWDGTQWVKGQRIQARQRGADRLFTVPTTNGWRVDLGRPQHPIRYWDGVTTNFEVDDDGNVTARSILVAQSEDTVPAITVDATGAVANARVFRLLDELGDEAFYIDRVAEVRTFGSYRVYNSGAGFATQAYARLFEGGLEFGNGITVDVGFNRTGSDTLTFFSDNDIEWGAGPSVLHNTGYVQLSEQTAPAAPAANKVRIYAVDNGGGKTQVMALFSSGAAQQVAIQP